MFKEFKEFAMKGNVVDLAVGVIIGAAFGKIVTSLVNDIIMPPIGALTKGLNFKNLYVAVNGQSYPSLKEAQEAGAPVILYGQFINVLLEFLIVAWCVFMLVQAITRLQRKPVEQAEETKTQNCPYCVSVISAEATRCPHCTSQLSEAPAAAG